MWVNLKPLYLFGGKLKMEYTYTPPEISNEYFKGRKRSKFVLLENNYDLGTLTLPIVFHGKNRHDVGLKKSEFEHEIFGEVDINLLDGYGYFAFLDKIGEASFPAEWMIETTYEFRCIRHGKYKEVAANTVYCESTLPNTDCVLDVSVGAAGTNYKVGTVTFSTVKMGEKISVDGIKKRILINGAPAANRAEWLTFPSLSPGKNSFACKDTLSIGYYPVYF